MIKNNKKINKTILKQFLITDIKNEFILYASLYIIIYIFIYNL